MRPTSILTLLLTTAAAAQPLQDALRARIGKMPGDMPVTVSLYAKNLDTGVTAGIHESDPVRTASTIKLPIMLAVFDAVARGQAKWTEPLTVTAAEKGSGSDILAREISDGVRLRLAAAVQLMLVLSAYTA